MNRGTGAGGLNTNLHGLKFERNTNVEDKLITNLYTKKRLNKNKYGYYFVKELNDKKIIYVTQSGFKDYIEKHFDISIFRKPDEAYIIIDTKKHTIKIKILEKKEQQREGSVETKLWSCLGLKREYEIVFDELTDYYNDVTIEYGFCVNKFLYDKINNETKKFKIFNQICLENEIDILNGDDENYYTQLDKWINK